MPGAGRPEDNIFKRSDINLRQKEITVSQRNGYSVFIRWQPIRLRSIHGTYVCAGAAIDALVRVNGINGIAFRYGLYGTFGSEAPQAMQDSLIT